MAVNISSTSGAKADMNALARISRAANTTIDMKEKNFCYGG
ncbi:hypothetical protein CAter282_2150 [Collimonas arenae]|uniref:Uncharacterized protein n=1 Tax=Collimonas arenae TaxID=279058 RepID=A0A127PQW5_9BURK|nr:hypothetical protein CAter10_2344 [Collimonas arenae]AMP09907.1 hypothetical protein CAter282_2150 [Collimonas arenae]